MSISRIKRIIGPAFLAIIFLACEDSSEDLQKEKEMHLLRQYLESKNINVEPQSSGLYYVPITEGSGIKPEKDHWVVIRYTARLVNDRVFDTTDEKMAVSNNIYSSSVIYGDNRLSLASLKLKGVIEGLMLMKEGTSALLIIPSHLGYGGESTGSIPPYSTLIYDIELLRVIPDPEVYEQQLIDNYISQYSDSAHLEVNLKESGIYYIQLSEGTGTDSPEDSDMVSVYYKGTLTDGRQFDTNIGSSALNFTIGENQTVSGFEEGVKLMKKDERARILMPSSLAYGAEGSGKIPGYTPLVFYLELINIQ